MFTQSGQSTGLGTTRLLKQYKYGTLRSVSKLLPSWTPKGGNPQHSSRKRLIRVRMGYQNKLSMRVCDILFNEAAKSPGT
mmetsp:Transcript_25285/g.32169  ORF Transcript_25285/g.32169 Transcript_25285/m.32169 type:complete len:80 (+) Transcript_25285:1005-1244(+)